MTDSILVMKNITKEFPGVKALDNVNLEVRRGEIHALVGENGAGKSTLMNVLSGTYPYGSYEGQILYDGQECQFKTVRDSEKIGIVIIHQELALIPELSIGENMFLGNERKGRLGIDWDETYAQAQKHMFALLEDTLKEPGLEDLGVVCHQPLRWLLRDLNKLAPEEQLYVTQPGTHVDFLVFNRVSKKPVLAIEVDGVHYHKAGTVQHHRDQMKDRILAAYGLKLLRLATDGSGEYQRLKDALVRD